MMHSIARCVFLLGFVGALFSVPAQAQQEFAPSAVEKGVFLVASPRMDDPNFRQTVLCKFDVEPFRRHERVVLAH